MSAALQYQAEPFVPRLAQRLMIKFLLEHAAAGIFADVGVGKTGGVLAAFRILRRRRLASRMLVVAPLRVAHLVWPAEVAKWQEFHDLKIAVLHGPKRDELLASDADVCVVNYEGLDWLLQAERRTSPSGRVSIQADLRRFRGLGFDTLVIDECFPAGTAVRTWRGDEPIENICVGNLVETGVGLRRVTRTQCRKTYHLVELELGDGRKITCTPSHPFFTDAGWLTAERCIDRRLFSLDEVQGLRDDFPTENNLRPLAVLKPWHRTFLQEILQYSSEVHRQSATTRNFISVDEDDQQARLEQGAAVVGGVQGGVVKASQGTRYHDSTGKPRRQRSWPDIDGDAPADDPTGNVYAELRDLVGEEAARLSYELQGRLRRSGNYDSDRGRWREPLWSESAGRKERRETDGTRVVGVTRIQSDGGCDVWNLEIEGEHVYFAGGVLVHNCTRVKHISSGRHKAIKIIAPTFARRWGLTGTPAPNGLIDLFGQALVLDLGRSFGPYITHYRRDFFVPSFDGFGWVMQKGAEERIYDRLRPLVLRLAAKDYVDMPELVENTIGFDLPPVARRVYDALEDDLIAQIGEHTVIASNVAAASTKLRQVSGGAIYLADLPSDDPIRAKLPRRAGAREFAEIHDAKIDALRDLIEELNGAPLLVAYDFRHDLERLKKALDAPAIGGGTSTREAARLEAAWNRGELPVLLGHPASIGHGLNLQGAGNHIAFFGLPWDLELRDQFIGRVRRQGQRHARVFVHYLTARDTVDETIYWALRGKTRVQDALLAALRK